MTTATPPVVGAPDASVLRRLSAPDRLLPLWSFAAMALGLLLGRVYPGLGPALDRVQVGGVSSPIAIGLVYVSFWARRRYFAVEPLAGTPAQAAR